MFGVRYLFWVFFVKSFCHVLDVSGGFWGAGRIGTGPGDVFTCVLTSFHRKRAAGDRVMRLKLFKLTGTELTSIKFRAYLTPWTDKKTTVLKNRPLMKPSPIQWNRLKICPLGDFDMLKSNLTSKTFESATQTSKWRKTTSKKLCF